MNVDNYNRSQRTLAAPFTVGTGGRVEWMRGPGACPGGEATLLPHLHPLSLMNIPKQDRYGPVILSEAKDLTRHTEILRFAQDDIANLGC